MNKKLLLILSILMSLSLLSCAKSVTAPDNSIGTPGQESLTLTEIQNELKKIGKFYVQEDPSGAGKDAYFDFNNGYFSGTKFLPEFKNNTGTDNIKISQSDILIKLKDALAAVNSSVVTFSPNPDWDNTITGLTPRELITSITSSLFEVPEAYKTIVIQ